MLHRNIPVFIPHMGCPHRCVFCDQNCISGQPEFDERSVPEQINAALATLPEGAETEIAYFGGSFTGIERGLMIRLLELASGYVKTGRISGIRLSTRPDMIDSEILEILQRYPVHAVELGLQSMDDRVLFASRRGHTAKQAADACRAVVDAGFSLVGQMMIGLPDSTPQNETETAHKIIQSGASAVRIYPTVVFRNTALAKMMEEGKYLPLTLKDAVERSASVLEVFQEYHIPCLRIGLCASDELISPESAIAGPNHPALGELVLSWVYYRKLLNCLRDLGLLGQKVELYVPQNEISQAVGQHRSNLERLAKESGTVVCKIREVPRGALLTAVPWRRI